MTSSSIAAAGAARARASVARRWLIAAMLCTVAMVVSERFVDRPLADFAQAQFRQSALYAFTNRALGWLLIVLPVSVLILLAAGARAIARRPLPSWLRDSVLLSWGVVWSLAAAVILKRAIGRTSPDPTWVVDRVYAFRFLRGAPGDEAFPSATTAVAAAIVAILWMRYPKGRRFYGIGLGLIAVVLVLTNNHWLSDVIGGALLGSTIGVMNVHLHETVP